jgi:hypothetical protein
MPLKITLIMDLDRSGWTESYYFADPPNQSANFVVNALADARVLCLGSAAKIIGARATYTATPKKSLAFTFVKSGKASDGDGKTATVRVADQAHSAVLIPFVTERGTKRFVTLSGFPDGWMFRENDADFFGVDPAGVTALNKFAGFLTTTPWPLVIRERKIDGENSPKTVTALTQHTDGRYKAVYAGGANLAVGDKVVLTQMKGNNTALAKGTRKVAELIDATTFTLDTGPRADLGTIQLQAGAKVSKVGYIYSPAALSPQSYLVTTRKRGRPFSARRGRRSASR